MVYDIDNQEQVEKYFNQPNKHVEMNLNKVLKSERLGNILQEMVQPRGDTNGDDK